MLAYFYELRQMLYVESLQTSVASMLTVIHKDTLQAEFNDILSNFEEVG